MYYLHFVHENLTKFHLSNAFNRFGDTRHIWTTLHKPFQETRWSVDFLCDYFDVRRQTLSDRKHDALLDAKTLRDLVLIMTPPDDEYPTSFKKIISLYDME